MNFRGIIKLALSFLIPFIALIFLIPKFFGLELTQNAVLLLALYAFVIFGVISIYRKIGHQGQLLIWIGIVTILGSLIALAGSVGINGSEQLIDLPARSQGFSLIGLAVGGTFLIIGLKQMNAFAYGLGNIRRR